VTLRRIRSFYFLLDALGLFLYLWPALRAPVVHWSDSHADLAWARAGDGIFSPAPFVGFLHPAKPFFILFLKAIWTVAPAGAESRWIVVVQSLILWGAIAGTARFVGKRLSPGRGLVLYAVLLSTLRLRDASSAVMSEPLATALLLGIAAALLDPPTRPRAVTALGVVAGVLFLVLPNVGAVAALLAAVALAQRRQWRAPVTFAVAFLGLVLPILALTAPNDRWRGLSPAFDVAAAEYAWMPASGLPPSANRADAERELAWRLFHGLLGTEYYDARWSARYRNLTEASRLLTPWLIVAAIAVLLAVPRNPRSPARLLGLVLLGALLVQGLVLPSIPRFGLPMLPALLLFAIAAPVSEPPVGRLRLAVGAAAAILLVITVSRERQVLDWEWGMIEAPGVRILQTIPRGALPGSGPATLHVRIAAPLLPSSAGLTLFGTAGEILLAGDASWDRRRSYLSVTLPPAFLELNRARPVTFEIASRGIYAPTHYFLFPVIPPPWSAAARRVGGEELSPATGVARGALDWWAHPGAD
jgi:hypothetical protein